MASEPSTTRADDEAPADRGGHPGGRGRRETWWSRREARTAPYLYISPFFILFAIFGLFPIGYTAWIALHDWHLLSGQGDWVGFGNFGVVLGAREFWIALRNTLSIFVIQMIPQVAIALAIAAALDRNLRLASFWRMGVLVPYVVTPVAVTLIFNSLFADQSGLINELLGRIGLDPIGWHVDTLASHVAIATMVNFRYLGYVSLIFLAGMQAIPRDYYEAATIDGAGAVRQFFSITIPQLRGTIIFIVVTATIGGLQIFDEPRLYDVQGTGGSNNQWLTLSLYLYILGWDRLDFGRAAAVAWLLFALIVVVSLVNLALSRRISTSEGRRAR